MDSSISNKINISVCIISIFDGSGGLIPTSNLVKIIGSFASSLLLILGNDDEYLRGFNTYSINYKAETSLFRTLINQIISQLIISKHLVKNKKNIDCCIFFLGGQYLLLPIFTAKIFKKKIILINAGSGGSIDFNKDYISKALTNMSRVSYMLSDEIIIYSCKLVGQLKLNRYLSKIFIAHEHFLDLDKFKIEKNFSDRSMIIGYVGRLSKEKGIENFLKAIPKIQTDNEYLRILIIGDGPLYDEICNKKRYSKLEIIGWISHEDLPTYLNEMRILVLPSYIEGLPNIVLESMACGTIVLGTAAGAISDLIIDGETGFILDDNTPDCIANGIAKISKCDDIQKIIANARALVEREFIFNVAEERYRKLVLKILG